MISTHRLNTEQQLAVESTEGALLVLAGAGSGKTRVVTHRIVHLLEKGVPPSQILGVTFTNKAAQEMKERIHRMTSSYVLISTFHSLGARILRESIAALGYRSDFTIYDEEDVLKTIKAALPDDSLRGDVKQYRSMISKAKNAMLSPEVAKESDPFFTSIYTRYTKLMQDYNALDFDDLLYLTARLFNEHLDILETYQDRFRYLLIDEYQDTNETQYRMIKALSAKWGNVCAVGDPDQSIYSWRGANINNILDFERDFPGGKVVRLEQNYRSCTNILNGANAVITNNSGRLEKRLWSDLGEGEKIKWVTLESERDEAQFVIDQIRHLHINEQIPLSEMAIFYRTNAQSRPFEDRFLFARLPYVIVGGISFYQRREIKDILAFLRLVQSNSDFVSFSRTLNLPKRGIGEATLNKLRIGAEEAAVPILEYLQTSDYKLSKKQREGMNDYLRIIIELRKIKEEQTLSDLVTAAIEKTGYLAYLKSDPDTFSDRKDNLDELISKAHEWEDCEETPTLEAFLEELSLKSTLDETINEEDRINLMTAHNGKGLEYKVVFLVGLEEDLFPHANSRENPVALEEERRLFYVGMTRAKERLYLTHVHLRYLWGSARMQRPSRFLFEVPSEFVKRSR